MPGVWDTIQPFVLGGASGVVATTCIQPIDTVKVRIQISGESRSGSTNPLSVGASIIKQDGVQGLYKGLSSAIFRQVTYGTARLGTFTYLVQQWKLSNPGKQPAFLNNVYFGVTAGVLGCIVGNPSDLVLVRIQSDGTLPVEERRNYRGIFDAFRRIVKEEGLYTLWRGSSPTMGRAISLTVGQLASFSLFKEQIQKARGITTDDFLALILASTCSGVVCATCSLPFDNLKTKLQRMKVDKDGKLPYKGLFDCFKQSVAREGPTGLWIGLPTYIVRIAPHSIISLMVLDYLKAYFLTAPSK